MSKQKESAEPIKVGFDEPETTPVAAPEDGEPCSPPKIPSLATFNEVFSVPRLDVDFLQERYDIAAAALKRLAKLLKFARSLEEADEPKVEIISTTDTKPE